MISFVFVRELPQAQGIHNSPDIYFTIIIIDIISYPMDSTETGNLNLMF